MPAYSDSDFDVRLAGFLSADETRSGAAIAAELGCSRTAVWKHVEALRAHGIGVDAVAGQGYRLRETLELLNESRIRTVLEPRTRAALNELALLNVVDSTNRWLQARPAESQVGMAVLAECQTSGRGRRGQTWVSPFGRNIYLSFGWRFDSGVGELSSLPLVLALSACEALEDAGLRDHRVKWPNDLRVGRKKIGGCLVEVQGDVNGPCHAILGVGINVRMPAGFEGAEAIDQPWTDVSATVPDISRNLLAGGLLNALAANLDRFAEKGFEPFRPDWKRRDELVGSDVVLSGPGGPVSGRYLGISSRGGMRLHIGDRVREFLAGEVSLARQADKPASD